jgi:hypothetical protein
MKYAVLVLGKTKKMPNWATNWWISARVYVWICRWRKDVSSVRIINTKTGDHTDY